MTTTMTDTAPHPRMDDAIRRGAAADVAAMFSRYGGGELDDTDEAEGHDEGAGPVRKTRKPPTWNLGASGDGRMLITNRAVQPSLRSGEGCRGSIDLAAFRGRVIGLKQNAIGLVLGADKPTVRSFVAMGLLRRHGCTNAASGTFYRFDPAWTMLDLHAQYVRRILRKPRTHRDFDAYKRVHHAFRLGGGHPVPPVVYEAALEKVAEIGSTEKCEINAFIPLGEDEHLQCQRFRKDLNRFCRERKGGNPLLLDDDFVRAQVPEFLNVPRTALHADRHHEWPSPPGEAIARMWALGPMRRPGLLLIYLLAATHPRRETLMETVRALEAIDAAFRLHAPDGSYADRDTMELVLGHVAFGTTAVRAKPYARDDAVRRWLIVHRLLDRWIRHTGGLAFQAFAPAQVDAKEFREQLEDVYGHLRPQAQARRLKKAGEAADRLIVLQEIAYLRKEGIADTGSIARRAIASMGDTACVKFSVYDRVISFNGVLLPGAQRNDWVAWRRAAFGTDLPDLPDDPSTYVPPAPTGMSEDPGASVLNGTAIDLDGYVFEYLGCEAVVGDDAFDPFFVTIAECGAQVAPGALEPEMQELRHRLIIDGDLPRYPSTPEGLLRFGASDAALFRRTARRRRTIVPLFQMEMAMRFAHLALRSICESYCRSGEFRQMQHRRSFWPKKQGNGLTQVWFKAFGKVPGGKGRPTELDEFHVSEQTHDEAFDLAELIVLFQHAEDGLLPIIAPPTSFAWKCEPGPYIFSWNGKALGLGPLLVFLRYLLGGTGVQHDFHDFRHAAAKEANACGLPMIQIQEALKHAHPSMTAYYATLTAEQVAQRTVDDLARRRAYLVRREMQIRAAARNDARLAA